MCMPTFPFKVVAAKSFASGVAPEVDRMACVVVQASGLSVTAVSTPLLIADHGRSTYRLLELLQVVMGLRLLPALNIALHHHESRQDWRKALGPCRRHLEGVEHNSVAEWGF